jgi:hypothetical protein
MRRTWRAHRAGTAKTRRATSPWDKNWREDLTAAEQTERPLNENQSVRSSSREKLVRWLEHSARGQPDEKRKRKPKQTGTTQHKEQIAREQSGDTQQFAEN